MRLYRCSAGRRGAGAGVREGCGRASVGEADFVLFKRRFTQRLNVLNIQIRIRLRDIKFSNRYVRA